MKSQVGKPPSPRHLGFVEHRREANRYFRTKSQSDRLSCLTNNNNTISKLKCQSTHSFRYLNTCPKFTQVINVLENAQFTVSTHSDSFPFSLLPFGFVESAVTQIVTYAVSGDEQETTLKMKRIFGWLQVSLISKCIASSASVGERVSLLNSTFTQCCLASRHQRANNCRFRTCLASPCGYGVRMCPTGPGTWWLNW